MKNFDLAAAKCGAIVCTKAGWAARILCFNFNGNDEYHICAAVMRKSVEFVQFYMNDGRTGDTDDSLDLMMADDDYMEKLDRGEYGTPAHIPDPWDEFKRQAALELIRIIGAPIGSRYVTDIVEKVNGIADGLKSK